MHLNIYKLDLHMKKLFTVLIEALFIMSLGGCLASTTSPDGVNCDYSKEKPLRDMPPDCQGGR